MNIVNELRRVARKNFLNQEKEIQRHLDSVKANLAMETEADKDLLKMFGTESVVTGQKNRSVSVKKFIEREFVSKDDIKKICMHYKLRFLPSAFYKKEIPLKVLHDLRNFQERNQISDQRLQNGLKVIAPSSHFTLGPRPQKDPALLYEKEKDVYQVVSQWGSDFNFWRRICGLYHSASIFMQILAALLVVNGFCTIMCINDVGQMPGTWFLLNMVLTIPIAILLIHDFRTWGELWDKPHR